MTWKILQGDCRAMLATLPDSSAQTCVTSPPYWGLRDYGVDGQLGLEPTPAEYVANMVEVFRDVRRVLRDDGTLWLNLGDSYAAGKCGRDDEDEESLRRRFEEYGTGRPKAGRKGANGAARKAPEGLKPKDLVGIPWAVAFALRADGWYLRSDIIWSKPNPMPESVTDRPTKAHEYLFLMSKSERYFYDADAIKEPAIHAGRVVKASDAQTAKNGQKGDFGATAFGFTQHDTEVGDSRNRRTVWTVATTPFTDAHFATFPTKLIQPCIMAGAPVGGVVLDPFNGAGTTGLVATRLQRSYVGIELNPEYVEMARRRIEGDAPLFNMASGE